jgi:hypothetical protein
LRSKVEIDMTPLDAAITWIQKGFSPVPVPHRSKRPVLKEWQRLEITKEGASQYFNGASQNIGVLLGDKFGSADVDCDCPEAITAAREFLPETGLIFGRQSKPFSHFFYRSDPPARTMQFIDPLDQSTIVELRGLKSDGSIGLQTVVPPSIHESGEPVRFEQGFEGIPANIDADVLVSAVHRVAAAALLARHWPTKGSRHQHAQSCSRFQKATRQSESMTGENRPVLKLIRQRPPAPVGVHHPRRGSSKRGGKTPAADYRTSRK